MKSLLFFALLFLGVSFGLQAQDAALNASQKATCKKVCKKKAEGESVMFTSILGEAGKQKSCTAKMAKKANCKPANCKPANCKPASCKPANCKPGKVADKPPQP